MFLFSFSCLLPVFSESDQDLPDKKGRHDPPTSLPSVRTGRKCMRLPTERMNCWKSASPRKLVTESILVGSSPLGLAIADEGKTALVACKDSSTVAVVDLDHFRTVGRYQSGRTAEFRRDEPSRISCLRNQLWSHQGRPASHCRYARAQRGVPPLKMGISPFALAVSPTTELVYVVMGGEQ